jgi:outer membrane immunogenic protein
VESQAAITDVVKLGVNYQFGGSSFGDLPFAPAANRAATTPAIFKAPAYKAPAAATAANYWTGCYAGIHGVPESSGGFAGGQLGCDVQTGALVFGLEGEAAWSRIVNRVDFSSPAQEFDQEFSNNLLWTADGAARAGIAIDRGLFYGKAGIAAGRFKFSSTELLFQLFDHGSTTLTGLLLGGGIEYALAPNWSVLLEYDRIAYAGRVAHFDAIGAAPFDETRSATVNEAKAGINYRFGGGALPPTRGGSQNLLPPPTTDWTGCYAGVHAGGGIIDDAFVPPAFIISNSASGGGAIAGAQAGCNYHRHHGVRP